MTLRKDESATPNITAGLISVKGNHLAKAEGSRIRLQKDKDMWAGRKVTLAGRTGMRIRR
jgi:hypothetical protein